MPKLITSEQEGIIRGLLTTIPSPKLVVEKAKQHNQLFGYRELITFLETKNQLIVWF